MTTNIIGSIIMTLLCGGFAVCTMILRAEKERYERETDEDRQSNKR